MFVLGEGRKSALPLFLENHKWGTLKLCMAIVQPILITKQTKKKLGGIIPNFKSKYRNMSLV